MQLYDKDGDLDVVEYNKYVIGISPTKLKQVPYAVGIAGGVHKAEAIRGAIQGRYINVLITDQKCAEELYRLGGE